MPKTAVDENNFASRRENKVRAAGEIAPVKPVAESVRMDHATDHKLWPGVFAFYRLHGSPSDFRRFHELFSSADRSQFRFFGNLTIASDTSAPDSIGTAVFDFKIDIIDFVGLAAEALMECFQELHVVK